MKTLLFGNGAASLESIRPYQTIDFAADAAFDDLTRLAAYVCQAPIALLCCFDASRWWLKSQVGLAPSSTDAYVTLCTQMLQPGSLDSGVLVIQDALADKRIAECDLVSASEQIRFYASVPIVTPQGLILGILSVIDRVPRELTLQQQEALAALGRQAVSLMAGCASAQLELRDDLTSVTGRMSECQQELRFFSLSPDLLCILSRDGYLMRVNPAFERTLNYKTEELRSRLFIDFVHPEDKAATLVELEKLFTNASTIQFEHRYRCQDGSYKWLTWSVFGVAEDGLVYAIARDITESKQTKSTLLERSRHSTLEADIGAALGQADTLSESLKHCTEAMVQHLDAMGAGIWTVERAAVGAPALLSLQLQASTGQITPPDIFPLRSVSNHDLISAIAQTKQPISTPLSAQDKEIGTIPTTAQTFFGGYPLIVESRVVGVIALHSRQPFSNVVHRVMRWVANTIAIAIDRAWAREELLSRREALLFLLASQIRNSLDLDTILDTAVTEIRNLLGVDCCHFLWYFSESDQPSLSVTHEARDAELPSLLGDCPSPQLVPLAETIRHLCRLRIDNLAEATGLEPETQLLLTDWGITSGLLLPLKTHSGQLGAILCLHYHQPRQWNDHEVELLQAVVDQLAIAIEQAELFAKTRAAALAAQTQAHQLERALSELQQTESRLIQTEKMSSLGQMVAGIAHEINNPVTFITGNLCHATNYIQDLLDLVNRYQQHYSAPAQNIQKHIEEIDLDFIIEDLPKILSSMKLGADRIHEIVLSLKNFSRLDEAEMKPVDIHEGINSTLLILHSRLRPSGDHPEITIIKEYGVLPLVECYANQLNQVFMNIISNAIDALENQPEPRSITIRTEVLSTTRKHDESQKDLSSSTPDAIASGNIVIRIRDNGPGMAPSVIKRLFDPFFTTKPVGKGTGLGLSISYQIVVEKHGGILKCFSEPGQGAEFWIEIPIIPPNAPSLS